MKVRTFADGESLAWEAATLVAGALREGVRTLVLTGGSTPRRTYELLAGMDAPWGRVSVLFGDERCVPPDDPESNYLMAKVTLLDRVYPASVHRMPAELGPEAGAELYEEVVSRVGPLDLVLLGIGPDGHIASLFPGHPQLEADGLAVGVRNSPKPPSERVSLTLGVLQGARRVVVLVSGADKAEAVAKARDGLVPAGMVPQAEFLLDRAAAARL